MSLRMCIEPPLALRRTLWPEGGLTKSRLPNNLHFSCRKKGNTMQNFSHALRGAPRVLHLGRRLSRPASRIFSPMNPTHMNDVVAHQFSPRCIHSSSPSYGVMDSFRNVYDTAFASSEEKRAKKVFDAHMAFMTDKERPMNGDTFLELISSVKAASGMGGVKENLPWVQNNPVLQDFKNQELVVCSMTPAERRDISSVRLKTMKRIASTTSLSLESVEDAVGSVDFLCRLQKWVLKRVESGLPLPRNSKEMQGMIMARGSGFKGKTSGGQRFQNPGIGGKPRKR